MVAHPVAQGKRAVIPGRAKRANPELEIPDVQLHI